MSRFFPHDSYHTPAETPRSWLDRLCLTPPLYFYASCILLVARARLLVARGPYNQAAWAYGAYEVLKLIDLSSRRRCLSTPCWDRLWLPSTPLPLIGPIRVRISRW